MVSSSSANVGQAAVEAWDAGHYCAESVLLALARAQGIESELLPRIATGFCSGIARTSGMCGALAGAVMGIGLARGRDGTGTVEPCYEATRRLVARFEEQFGSRDCGELLGCDLGTTEGQAVFRDQHLSKRCVEFTRAAAEFGADALEPQG